MLARCDRRGLAIQTGEFFRNMRPAATLVVKLGQLTPYEERATEYEVHGLETRSALWDGQRLPDEAVNWLLDRSDVIYSAETVYDFRIIQLAQRRGIPVVVQGNFEFLRWLVEANLPRPDLFLAPSRWHIEDWPEPVKMLPFPVARDRLPFQLRTKALTFLHVAGHRAMQDRNGTRLLLQALHHVRSPVRVVIRSQSRLGTTRAVRRAKVEIVHADVADYWTLYEGADVLLAPRRYGGQSLPMNEAMSCGMPVVSLDVEPQRAFLPPESLVPAHRQREIRCQAGYIECHDTDPSLIARKIDELAGDDALVEHLSKEADAYAHSISWEVMGPRYRELFESLT